MEGAEGLPVEELAEEQDWLEEADDDGLPVDDLANCNDWLEDGFPVDEVALPVDKELELPDSEKREAGGRLPQNADETESVGPDGDKRPVDVDGERLDDCADG